MYFVRIIMTKIREGCKFLAEVPEGYTAKVFIVGSESICVATHPDKLPIVLNKDGEWLKITLDSFKKV